MFIQALPYQERPVGLFAYLRKMPWAQLLDSGQYSDEKNRYDIMVAAPEQVLITRGQDTLITHSNGEAVISADDPFDCLKTALPPKLPNPENYPFVGGAVGFWGYDLLNKQYGLSKNLPKSIALPDMAIGIYHWTILTDHKLKQTRFIAIEQTETISALANKISGFLNQDPKPQSPAQPLTTGKLDVDIDFPCYQQAFDKIQRYLLDGDCYQINFARCFSAKKTGTAWQSYQQLRLANPVPFGAFLDFPFAKILSASPERFLKVSNGSVETRPIKGTRPRGKTPEEDAALKKALSQSSKDRAENLMIVDLLRNDLGKSCVPGSITVSDLFEVESFPTVHHLVSTVTGRLSEAQTPLDVLKNCFPGGSVTGAPKKRAMEIIQELEQHRRGIYCGSIGYISFCGNMDTNIAIRTMTVSGDQLTFWAGGGIVADSDVEKEFQETNDKAKAFFDLLETN